MISPARSYPEGMKTKVLRRGRSLMISIPIEWAQRAGIHQGDEVWVADDIDGVTVRPYKSPAEVMAGWKRIGTMTGAEAARAVIEQREEHAKR